MVSTQVNVKACKEGLFAEKAADGSQSTVDGSDGARTKEPEAGDLTAITKLVRCSERDVEGRARGREDNESRRRRRRGGSRGKGGGEEGRIERTRERWS
jgi:hypothetical protein